MTTKIVIIDRVQSDKDCSHAQPTWSSSAGGDNSSFDDRDFRVTALLADGQIHLSSNLSGARLSPDRAIELAQLIASSAAEAQDFDAELSHATHDERALRLSPESGKPWHELYEDKTFYRNKNSFI